MHTGQTRGCSLLLQLLLSLPAAVVTLPLLTNQVAAVLIAVPGVLSSPGGSYGPKQGSASKSSLMYVSCSTCPCKEWILLDMS